MKKDFDNWNETKKHLHGRQKVPFAHPREIWWCALGVNVGAETDGKNTKFERPVVVVRVYNKDTILVLPTTSVAKNDRFHCIVRGVKGLVSIKLTQVRVVSSKRLLRKVDSIPENEFARLRAEWKNFL